MPAANVIMWMCFFFFFLLLLSAQGSSSGAHRTSTEMAISAKSKEASLINSGTPLLASDESSLFAGTMSGSLQKTSVDVEEIQEDADIVLLQDSDTIQLVEDGTTLMSLHPDELLEASAISGQLHSQTWLSGLDPAHSLLPSPRRRSLQQQKKSGSTLSPAGASGIVQFPEMDSRFQVRLMKQPDSRSAGPETSARVVSQPLILSYHNGPLLVGRNDSISVYLIFYGNFTQLQRSVVRSFLRSLEGWPKHTPHATIPTVAKWWSLTARFRDRDDQPVAHRLVLSGHIRDQGCSLGKSLTSRNIEDLVLKALSFFPADSSSLYLVLTAEDVQVEGFCMHYCGFHFYTAPTDVTRGQMLPYAWVGNARSQCAPLCCWPFSEPYHFTPPSPSPLDDGDDQGEVVINKALISPNSDIGLDGMIICLASVLVGAATDPYGTGYFQGDATGSLEAAAACEGKYGEGAYPGYPGKLLKDITTNASFNAYGYHRHQFLLPWMWNPSSLTCAGQA